MRARHYGNGEPPDTAPRRNLHEAARTPTHGGDERTPPRRFMISAVVCRICGEKPALLAGVPSAQPSRTPHERQRRYSSFISSPIQKSGKQKSSITESVTQPAVETSSTTSGGRVDWQ